MSVFLKLSTPATWYRIINGDDCLSNLIRFARGPSTKRPGPIKSSHNQLVVITVGGILEFSYQAAHVASQCNNCVEYLNKRCIPQAKQDVSQEAKLETLSSANRRKCPPKMKWRL
ncbi:hypothetical protein AHF37_07681 [Paragonimus kellicotti]|nr:hypothetical protein AHF37_07681 [Paragonimus kellicotti]